MTDITRRAFIKTVSAGGAGVAAAWPGRASWAMSRGPISPFRFVFFTDIHARTEWETPVAMASAAGAMNAVSADLAVCGGDLITDGFQSSAASVAPRWDAVMDMKEAITPPVEVMIGNHDLVAAIPEDGSAPAGDPRADFLKRLELERSWRTFEAGGCRFILLDPFEIIGGALRYRGCISAEQLDWIDTILPGISPDIPIILGTHMPLMTGFYQATQGAGAAAPENRVVVNSREVLSRFSGHNLVLVLQGHLHVNEMLRWQNTTFITGGAVCGRWWRGSWQGTQEGFGVVTLRNNRVDWEYRQYGWQARRPADR